MRKLLTFLAGVGAVGLCFYLLGCSRGARLSQLESMFYQIRSNLLANPPLEEFAGRLARRHGWQIVPALEHHDARCFLVAKDVPGEGGWATPQLLEFAPSFVNRHDFDPDNWRSIVFVRSARYQEERTEGWHSRVLVRQNYVFYGDSGMLQQIDRDLGK